MNSENNDISTLNSSYEIVLPKGECFEISKVDNAKIETVLVTVSENEKWEDLLEARKPSSFLGWQIGLLVLIAIVFLFHLPSSHTIKNSEMHWEIVTQKTSADNKLIKSINRKFDFAADRENEFLKSVENIETPSRFLLLKKIEILIAQKKLTEAYQVLNAEFLSKNFSRLPDVMYFSMLLLEKLDKSQIEICAQNLENFPDKKMAMRKQQRSGVLAWDKQEIKLRMKYWADVLYPSQKSIENRNYIDSALKITWQYKNEEEFIKLQDEIINLINKKWTNWDTISISLPDDNRKLNIRKFENFIQLKNAYEATKMRAK